MSTVNGDVAPGFGPVADAFRSNVETRGEQGAACCVVRDGRVVVDLAAGHADPEAGAAFQADTLVPVFSTTKGMTAVCMAMLADRGLLDVEAPVARYWPTFAGGGKDHVTVAECLSHRAGLAWLDERLTTEEILDTAPVLAALERQVPQWEPGTANGYHAHTYGWIAGEILRRIEGRSLGTFLAEEVARPLGADVHIGLPEALAPRVARLDMGPLPDDPDARRLVFEVMAKGTPGYRALVLDGAIRPHGGEQIPWNSRAFQAAEMPGANGIASARGLARMYAATTGEVDGVRLVSRRTIDRFRAERSRGPDKVVVVEAAWGLGFALDSGLVRLLGPSSYGHPGAGGSLGFADLDAGLGFGYVLDHMGAAVANEPRTLALVEALRACL